MRGDRAESISKQKRHSSSNDSPAEKRPHHEIIPLPSLVDKPEQLAEAAVNALSWDLIVGMLPDYLKSKSKEMIVNHVKSELEGMSRRRINSILEGHEISSSSSSESEESEDEVEERSDDENNYESGEEEGEVVSRNGRGDSAPDSTRSHTTHSSPSRTPSSRRSSEEGSGGESPLIELYEE